jgi:menaquinone-dependent protoporphyrinogen IX oxidase
MNSCECKNQPLTVINRKICESKTISILFGMLRCPDYNWNDLKLIVQKFSLGGGFSHLYVDHILREKQSLEHADVSSIAALK